MEFLKDEEQVGEKRKFGLELKINGLE